MVENPQEIFTSHVEENIHCKERAVCEGNVVSDCESSFVYDSVETECSLSPPVSENSDEYETETHDSVNLNHPTINGTVNLNDQYLTELQALKHQVMLKRTRSTSNTPDGTNVIPRREKEAKRRWGSVKNTLSLLSEQLDEISASDFCDTNLAVEETNVCGQLMKMEKVNADVGVGTSPDIHKKDNTELVDPASITPKQTTSRRGRKRKQTTDSELEVGISKSSESNGDALANGKNEIAEWPEPGSSAIKQITKRRGRKMKQTNELETAISKKLESKGGDLINSNCESAEPTSSATKQITKSRGRKKKQTNEIETASSKSLENKGDDLKDSNCELLEPASNTTKQTSCRGRKKKQNNELETALSKSLENKGGDLKEGYSELLDPASITSTPMASRRGCKRKTTELEAEASKSFESKGGDLNNSKVRKCRSKSKSVSDIQKDFLNHQELQIPDSHCSKTMLCTSTPIVKKTQDKKKQQKGRRGRSSLNISPKLADASSASIISESTIPSDVSSFDISLPTLFPVSKPDMMEPDIASGLDSSLPTPVKSLEFHSFVSSDTSRDKSCLVDSPDSCLAGKDPFEDSDSDEELPLGFTPIKLDRSFSVNDVVWVKWKQWPYLPAVVKQVYKQKKKLTLSMFTKDGLKENFTMSSTNRDRILFYWHPKKSDILASSMSLSQEERQRFHEAVAAAEKFLFDIGSQKDDTSPDSNMTDDIPVIDNVPEKTEVTEDTGENKDDMNNITSSESVNLSLNTPNTKNKNVTCTSTESSQNSTSKQKVVDKEKTSTENLCMKGLERTQKRSEQTKPITDFMKSKTMKTHLNKIYKGEIESALHNKFHTGSKKVLLGMKQHAFGPIDDEEQIESVLNVYLEWLQEIDTKPTDTKINYMFDVWFPEAVVFALKKVKRYSTKRAWVVFEKGVPRTKAEMMNIFPEYSWNVKKKSRFKKIPSFVEINESDLKNLSTLSEAQV